MARDAPRSPAGARPGQRARCRPAGLPVLLALVMAAAPVSAAETDPARALDRIERDISAGRQRDRELGREAERLRDELGELRARLVEDAREAQRLEQELTDLEEKLRILEEQEHLQAANLERERARIADLLGALQRLSRIPPEALAARPEAPVETLRGALLLRATVPELDRRAEALAGAIHQLAELRADIAGRRSRAQASRADLAARTTAMRDRVARREELAARTEAERNALTRRTGELAAEARDLRALIAGLETERRVQEQRRRAEAEARAAADAAARAAAAVRPPAPPERGGETLLPVAGKVILRYGEADEFGNASRGLTISARPGAAVISPLDGSIMFAGPFKGYGQILIVEHADGYHSLIAGLGRIDTRVGQQVLAGEPVGAMAARGDGTSDLYFELRRKGQPINPQRGISASHGRGQG